MLVWQQDILCKWKIRDLLGGCMNAEMIIEKVRDSIENYEVFKDLALNIRSKKYMDKNI